MAEERSPIELATDLFVYAPIGLAIELSKALPELIETGRSRAEAPLKMASMMGRAFASQQKNTPAGTLLEDIRKTTETCLERGLQLGGLHNLFQHFSTSNTEAAAGDASATKAKRSTRATTPPRSTKSTSKTPDVESLAIPSYGSLSASQILARLNGLSSIDLEAIRSYENATRARRTILARIDELLSQK